VLKYGSVCSGIEAVTVAWKPIGWTAAFFAEIEPFPRAILKHHYPDVALHGDFTTIGRDDYGSIELLVGGTPCQSFSVAGLRGGLDDERGNLALEFLRLADRKRPRWVVWENVPGVLSSNGGRDFGSILGGLVELGYGFAYRVLDAQFFGVPQRRRRVFVVGYFGNARRAAAVLFERHSLSGHPSPRGEAGKDVARRIADRARSGVAERTNAITGHVGSGVDDVHAREGWLIAAFRCKDYGADASNVAPTLRAMHHDASRANGGGQIAVAANNPVGYGSSVRRLTPVECERLQGFPDGWTAVPYRGKPAADGPRYRALGNSMAVPCMEWLGKRIAAVETMGLDHAC